MKKNFKNVGGGLLLEVLFMLAILMIIFPIMQKDMKKRTDNLRNQMVIKDLMKLKNAVEIYLKKNPTFEENVIIDLDLKNLVDSGLPASFDGTSVLGQNYRVRVKTSVDSENNSMTYDAIIIATGGNDIPTVRIREIVKEAKGYAGYVEDGMAYAPNWQLDIASWNSNNELVPIDNSSIVMKTGFSRKEYKYISRVGNVGSATMETDLYMNLQQIKNVNNLYIADTLEVVNLKANGSFVVSDVAVEETMTLNENMVVDNRFNFSNGINQSNLFYEDSKTENLFLANLLNIIGNLEFLEDTDFNRLRFVNANQIIFDGVIMSIANLLSFALDTNAVVKITNLELNSYNNESKSVTGAYAFKFGNIKSSKDPTYYINKNQMRMKDIIITDVNKKLLGRINKNQDNAGVSKIGGIDINERTPISVILRGLSYAYADIYKMGTNNYPPSQIINGWYYNVYKRCEFNECDSCAWNDLNECTAN